MKNHETSLRAQLVLECERIFHDARFDDLLHMLHQGGYCLELSYNQGDDTGDIPIGFIFDKKFLRTRLELVSERKAKGVILRPSREQIVQDILNFQKKLYDVVDTKLFRGIQELLHFNRLATYGVELAKEEFDWNFEFHVDGVWMLRIDTIGNPDFWGIGIDYNYIDAEEVIHSFHQNGSLLRIPEQSWYERLSPKTKLLLRVGTDFAEKTYLAPEKETVEDFSPILLSFIKAVECEIACHYQQHAPSLIDISEMIIKNLRLPSAGNGVSTQTIRDLRALHDLASKIKTFRLDYNPSGTLPLYYFLKFYALRSNIENLGFAGYLDEGKTSLLNSLKNGLDWLKSLGHNRNDFIHERIIDNEYEFLMHYDGICRTLKLLVQLKTSDGTDKSQF